jgi:hypothetical protein
LGHLAKAGHGPGPRKAGVLGRFQNLGHDRKNKDPLTGTHAKGRNFSSEKLKGIYYFYYRSKQVTVCKIAMVSAWGS